jgi:hypothetical protein
MSGTTIAVVAFIVALVVMAGAFMGGAVIVAVPVAIVAIAIVGFLDLNRRRKSAENIHSQEPGPDVDFSDRDRQTLISE